MPQLFIFFFLLLHNPKVIAISDGDTITVVQNNQQTKIRIDGIDAPERGMPYYKVSKKYLSDLCFGKNVTYHVVKIDRYGRSVAKVALPDGRDVSTEMIRAGMAWHYKAYSKDKKLSDLEIHARKQRSGLWREAKPMAPWTVRKLHRQGISTKKMFSGAPR